MMPLLRRQATGPSSILIPFIAQEEEVPSSSSLSSLPVDSKGKEIRKCPRCDSLNTKFCYYNNHCLSQPRHFCKSCRRFWTHGGFLHDVPIGGARRRTNSNSNSNSNSSSSSNSNRNSNINSNRNNNNKKRKRRSLSSLLPKLPLQNETKPLLQNGTKEEPTNSGENLEGVKNFPTEAASFFPDITTDGEDDELIGSSSTTGFMDLLLSGGVDPKEVFSFGSFSQLLNPSSDSAEIMAAQMVGGYAKAWNAF